MITKEQLFQSVRKPCKGVLTTAETYAITVNKRRNIYVTSSLVFEKYFFTDSYGFGYGVLPDHFTASSINFPIRVQPREGLEDGVVDTMFKFKQIFFDDMKQINTVDELVNICNQHETSAMNEHTICFDLKEYLNV